MNGYKSYTIKGFNPLCKVHFIVSSTVHKTLKELNSHRNVEFIEVQLPLDAEEYYELKTKTIFKEGSYQGGLVQNVLSEVAIDFSKDGNQNFERVLKNIEKNAEPVQKIDRPSNQSVNKAIGSG